MVSLAYGRCMRTAHVHAPWPPDLYVSQPIPFRTAFSADLEVDLIGFTGWVLEPLFTHREKGSSYAVLPRTWIGYWRRTRCTVTVETRCPFAGAGSGHANGLAGWRDCT